MDCSMFEETHKAKAVLHAVNENTSSDYGCDVIDLGFVGGFDVAMGVTNPLDDVSGPVVLTPTVDHTIEHIELVEGQPSRTTKVEKITTQDVVMEKCNVKDAHNSSITPPMSTTKTRDEDTFDDDGDDELFAADLENLAAVYDEPMSQENMQNILSNGTLGKSPMTRDSGTHQDKKSKVSTPAQEGIYVEVSSDDEFGEGLELEELASELTRATQEAEASSSSIVRTTHLRQSR